MKIDLRLYNTSGVRQPLPDKYVGPWDFETVDRGGYGTFSLTLFTYLDDTTIPALPSDNWRVEWWFDDVIAYRGWIELDPASIERGAPSVRYTGSGLASRLKNFMTYCRYANAGAANLNEAFNFFAEKYLTPTNKITSLRTNIDPLVPVQKLERLDAFGSNLLSIFDNLAEMANNALIWGFDALSSADKQSALDRLYVKNRPAALSKSDYVFSLGKQVRFYEEPKDLANVINSIRIFGGKAKAPNLLFNPSFEFPVISGEEGAGNLIEDPSFESHSWAQWTKGGDADIKTSGENYVGEYPRTGTYFLEIDDTGEYSEQTVVLTTALTVATPYRVVIPRAAETESGSRQMSVYLACKNASDTVLLEPLGSGVGSLYTVPSTAYRSFDSDHTFKAPATTKKFFIKIAWYSGSGPIGASKAIQVDDVQLYNTTDLAQEGWERELIGIATGDVDWARKDTSYHGIYHIRVVTGSCSNADNCVRIHPSLDRYFSCRPVTDYRISFWVRCANGLKGAISLLPIESTGAKKRVELSQWTKTGTDWEQFSATYSTNKFSQSFLPIIELWSDGTYDIDAVDLFEPNVQNRTGFLDGDTLVFAFNSDGTGDGGQTLPTAGTDPPSLSADAQTSIATYGLREAFLEVPEITDIERAKTFAVGYFNTYATMERQSRLTLEPCEVHVKYVEDLDTCAATGMVRIRGAGVTIPDQNPVRIHYAMQENGVLRCDLDLNRHKLDPAFLLKGDIGPRGGTASTVLGGTGGPGAYGGGVPLQTKPGGGVVIINFISEEFQSAWDADPDTREGGSVYSVTLAEVPVDDTPLLVFRGPALCTEWTRLLGVITFNDGERPITVDGVREKVIVLYMTDGTTSTVVTGVIGLDFSDVDNSMYFPFMFR